MLIYKDFDKHISHFRLVLWIFHNAEACNVLNIRFYHNILKEKL